MVKKTLSLNIQVTMHTRMLRMSIYEQYATVHIKLILYKLSEVKIL